MFVVPNAERGASVCILFLRKETLETPAELGDVIVFVVRRVRMSGGIGRVRTEPSLRYSFLCKRVIWSAVLLISPKRRRKPRLRVRPFVGCARLVCRERDDQADDIKSWFVFYRRIFFECGSYGRL